MPGCLPLVATRRTSSGSSNATCPVARFEEVLEEDKHNRYAIAELALVYLNKGKLDQAKDNFSKAIKKLLKSILHRK